MWLEPKESFGTLLNRYMRRKGMDLEDLAQAPQALGYSRDSVHPGRIENTMTDGEAQRWCNETAILKGMATVLELSREEVFDLTNAYLYRPPDRRSRRRR